MEATVDGNYEEPEELLESEEELFIPFEDIAKKITQFLDATTAARSIKLLRNTSRKHPQFHTLLGYLFVLAENGELDDESRREFEKLYKKALVIDMNMNDAKIIGSILVTVTITFLYILSYDASYVPMQRLSAIMALTTIILKLSTMQRNRRLPKKLERLEEEAIVMANAFAKLNRYSIEEREKAMNALTGISLELLLDEVDKLTQDEAAENLGDNLNIIHDEL